jgi:hypothetical protein
LALCHYGLDAWTAMPPNHRRRPLFMPTLIAETFIIETTDAATTKQQQQQRQHLLPAAAASDD